MTQAIVKQIIDQLVELEPEELQQLNQVIQKHLAAKEEAVQRTRFHKALLTSGLVKQLNQPSYNQQAERQLIQVQGTPVSETIIQERR
jgi:hypothetical protein